MIKLANKKSVGIILLVVGLVLAALAGYSYLSALRATAEIYDAKGDVVGHALFVQGSDGVHITVRVASLSLGKHGIHIHSIGRCDPPPNFTTAGGHFNPEGKHHGLDNPNGPHAGDLPNLEVGDDGTGTLQYIDPHVSLSVGASNSLLRVNGTSIVIHANPDDQMTDPSGNSGPRIACGIIVAAELGIGSAPAWLFATLAVTLIVIGVALLSISRKKTS
jgi:Cu-Zn family superoxide dismutase